MLHFLKSILRAILSTFNVLFTGGKFGTSVRSDNYHKYTKSQEQKRKDFATFGGRKCKVCGTRIPGNRHYCPSCYDKYIKK